MTRNKECNCMLCRTQVNNEILSLNRKLLGRNIKKYFCLYCLAEYLFCTEDDLKTQILEYKTQGCALFG